MKERERERERGERKKERERERGERRREKVRKIIPCSNAWARERHKPVHGCPEPEEGLRKILDATPPHRSRLNRECPLGLLPMTLI